MTVSHLTQKRVDTAGRKAESYVIHDRKLKGFGLKVHASGRKTYEVNITRSGRRHRETVGDTKSLTLKQARASAIDRIGVIEALHYAGPDTPFETMAVLAMRRRERHWKPSTMAVNRTYLNSAILPSFKDRTIGDITRRDVEDWFASLRDKPGTATRSASLLSVVMQEAEAMGARPEGRNPVSGLRRYRQQKMERTLTPDEMSKLGAILAEQRESEPLRTALLELLVLTGCRKGELINLHWRDYRNGHLYLPDSKTGPKKVYLCSHARSVLDGIQSQRSGPVFPSRSSRRKIQIDQFWQSIRREIGLEDVRLHDLRHHYASTAICLGVNLGVVGKLLGHVKPQTTMRYAHPDEVTMREAVELVGGALSAKNDGGAK